MVHLVRGRMGSKDLVAHLRRVWEGDRVAMRLLIGARGRDMWGRYLCEISRLLCEEMVWSMGRSMWVRVEV